MFSFGGYCHVVLFEYYRSTSATAEVARGCVTSGGYKSRNTSKALGKAGVGVKPRLRETKLVVGPIGRFSSGFLPVMRECP